MYKVVNCFTMDFHKDFKYKWFSPLLFTWLVAPFFILIAATVSLGVMVSADWFWLFCINAIMLAFFAAVVPDLDLEDWWPTKVSQSSECVKVSPNDHLVYEVAYKTYILSESKELDHFINPQGFLEEMFNLLKATLQDNSSVTQTMLREKLGRLETLESKCAQLKKERDLILYVETPLLDSVSKSD